MTSYLPPTSAILFQYILVRIAAISEQDYYRAQPSHRLTSLSSMSSSEILRSSSIVLRPQLIMISHGGTPDLPIQGVEVNLLRTLRE